MGSASPQKHSEKYKFSALKMSQVGYYQDWDNKSKFDKETIELRISMEAFKFVNDKDEEGFNRFRKKCEDELATQTGFSK